MIDEKIDERPERSEEKNPVEEVLFVVVRLVIVPEEAVRSVIDVVARVVVPKTTKPPVEVEEVRSERKAVFSSHDDPSQ